MGSTLLETCVRGEFCGWVFVIIGLALDSVNVELREIRYVST